MTGVRLRYLAALREAMGAATEELPVPPSGLDLASVLTLLRERHGEAAVAALTAPDVRLALNQELVAGEALRVVAGDELAFLPPVTGG